MNVTAWSVNSNALPGQTIEPSPALLDGRVHGWRLLQVTCELCQYRIDIPPGERIRNASYTNNLARRVLCICAPAQSQDHPICLLQTFENLGKLRGSAHAHKQQTVGIRIQGPRMPNSAGSCGASHSFHRIVGRHRPGFVNAKNAVKHAVVRSALCPPQKQKSNHAEVSKFGHHRQSPCPTQKSDWAYAAT